MAEENKDVVEGLSKVTAKLQNLADAGQEGNKDTAGGLTKVTAKLEDVKNTIETSDRAEADRQNASWLGKAAAQEAAEADAERLSNLSDEKREASLAKLHEEGDWARPKPEPLKPSYFKKIGEFMAKPIGEKFKLLKESKVGAAATEAKEKARRLGQKSLSYLESIAKGVSGMAKKAKDAIKSKLPSMSTLLMLGVAGAMLALMNSPAMAALKKFLLEDVIPVIADLWEKVLKPAFEATVKYFKEIWPDLKKGILALVELGVEFYKEHIHPIMVAWKDKFVKFFEDFKGFLKDPSWSSFGSLIGENKVAIASILLLLAPKLMFKGLLGSVKLLTPIALKLATAFGTFVTTLQGFLGIGLAPVLLILASIALLGYSLARSFEAMKKKWEETGSMFEVFKTGITELIANFLGPIIDLPKKLVSWIAGKLGFKALEKTLDEFSFTNLVRDAIGGWFLLFEKFMDIDWKGLVKGMLPEGKVGDWISNMLFGEEKKFEPETDDEARAAQAMTGQADEGEEESGTKAFDLSTAFFGEKEKKKLARIKALEGMEYRGGGEETELKKLRIEIEQAKKESASATNIVNDNKSIVVDQKQSSTTIPQMTMMNPDAAMREVTAAR